MHNSDLDRENDENYYDNILKQEINEIWMISGGMGAITARLLWRCNYSLYQNQRNEILVDTCDLSDLEIVWFYNTRRSSHHRILLYFFPHTWHRNWNALKHLVFSHVLFSSSPQHKCRVHGVIERSKISIVFSFKIRSPIFFR